VSKIAAILLAAGRSERMGAYKPLLPFGDKTVIESCVKFLMDGGVDSIIVVGGDRVEDLRIQLAHLPVTFAENPPAGSEMGVSIIRGVEKLLPDADAVFVALVDQPAIPSDVVRFMISERARTGALLLVPGHNGRRGHPVMIDLRYRNQLLTLDPKRGLRAFFEAHSEAIKVVSIDSPYIARDMDTWDDYLALYRDVFNSEPPIGSQSLTP
jgi:molybdenum cofactor cytidylyltransferase